MHGFKAILLKEAGFIAIAGDLAVPDDRGGGHDDDRDDAVQADAVRDSNSLSAIGDLAACRQTAQRDGIVRINLQFCAAVSGNVVRAQRKDTDHQIA